MKKVVVSVSSMPAGRNMSSQLEFLSRVTNYGADMYHIDVVDGEFAKYKTINYEYFEQLREKSPLLFDCHLMIENPEKYVEPFAHAGSDLITFHYEACENKVDEVIDLIKSFNKKN